MQFVKNPGRQESAASLARLNSFLPDQIYDIHAHLYKSAHFPAGDWPFLSGIDELGCAGHKAALRSYMPASQIHGLYFGLPKQSADRPEINNWIRNEVESNGSDLSRTLMLVSAQDDPESVAESLRKGYYAGIKVYHCYANRPDTMNAPICEYAPEWIWEILHEINGVLMLHIVRDAAISDPDNQQDIRRLSRKYPNMQLVLAHIARSFNHRNAKRGLHVLSDLDNVVLDTSAICETEAFRAALKILGPKKILWGSDFPVSELRGRCVTVGDDFQWLHPGIGNELNGTQTPMTLVGIESLTALQEACDDFGLSTTDIHDIFYNNAIRVLKTHLPSEKIPEEKDCLNQWTQTRQIISGGTGLLSKRPEMFGAPNWPVYYSRCAGSEVWDMNGRRYIDFAGGIGAVLIGYADPDINAAVQRQVRQGNYCTLVNPIETALAEKLLQLHPWAGKVKYARGGGEAMTMAIRIARAFTKKTGVVFCGYHGWHDWYLASNLSDSGALDSHLLPGLAPEGVPPGLVITAVPFRYNDYDSFGEAIRKIGPDLAAVVMEPVRSQEPTNDFLQKIEQQARRLGAVFIVDEVTSGFRYGFPGASSRLGIEPDIAVYAKALSNGYPFAAVIGKKQIMEGGERSFISSSYWTDGIGTAAANAALDKMLRLNIYEEVWNKGLRFMSALQNLISQFPQCRLELSGMPSSPTLSFGLSEQTPVAKAVFIRKMVDRGFLVSSTFYLMYAHEDRHIEDLMRALQEVLSEMEFTISDGTLARESEGKQTATGFARLV